MYDFMEDFEFWEIGKNFKNIYFEIYCLLYMVYNPQNKCNFLCHSHQDI